MAQDIGWSVAPFIGTIPEELPLAVVANTYDDFMRYMVANEPNPNHIGPDKIRYVPVEGPFFQFVFFKEVHILSNVAPVGVPGLNLLHFLSRQRSSGARLIYHI